MRIEGERIEIGRSSGAEVRLHTHQLNNALPNTLERGSREGKAQYDCHGTQLGDGKGVSSLGSDQMGRLNLVIKDLPGGADTHGAGSFAN